MGPPRTPIVFVLLLALLGGCAVEPVRPAVRGPGRTGVPGPRLDLPAAPYSYSDLHAIVRAVRADLRQGELLRARQRLGLTLPRLQVGVDDPRLVEELQCLAERIDALRSARLPAAPPR